MNSAKPMTLRDKIAFFLYENGPKTSEQIIKELPKADSKLLSNMHKWGSAIERVDGLYQITPKKRQYFDQCEIQPTYKGQVATSADPALNCKPWSGKFSFTNAPRREPIREVSFLNGGIGFGYGYQA